MTHHAIYKLLTFDLPYLINAAAGGLEIFFGVYSHIDLPNHTNNVFIRVCVRSNHIWPLLLTEKDWTLNKH